MKKFYSFLAVLTMALCAITVNAQTVTLDFTTITDTMLMGTSYDKESGVRGDQEDGAVIMSQDGVEITSNKAGAGNPARLWWYYNKNTQTGVCELRFYKGGELIISAPEGKAITTINFTARNLLVSPNVGSVASKQWTGNATSVVFSGTGTTQITVIEVTLADVDDNTQTDVVNVQIPVISPNGGTKTGSVKVTITGSESTTIYYTTDGVDPTSQSTAYTEPFTITTVGSVTVKAIAYDAEGNASGIASQTYTIKEDTTTVDPGTNPTDPTEPTTGVQSLPYNETFSSSIGAFTIENISMDEGLTYVWTQDSKNACMKASGYKSGTNYAAQSQIVSPVISLADAKQPVLAYEQVMRFFNSIPDELKILVRVVGADAAYDWSELTMNKTTSGSDWTFVKDTISLAQYAGMNIQLAFQYTSTGNGAATWEVKNLSVVDLGTEPTEPEEPATEAQSLPYSEAFSNSIGAFTIENISMDENLSYVWSQDSKNACMKASGYKSGTNYAAQSQIVSPVISLADAKEPVLAYEQVMRFFNSIPDELKILVRVVGSDAAYDWSELTMNNTTTGSDWTFVKDTISLAQYAGMNIQLAFKYTSTENGAATWEVKNLSVVDLAEQTEPQDPDEPIGEEDYPEVGEVSLPYEESMAEGIGQFATRNISRPAEIENIWTYDSRYACMKANAYLNQKDYDSESELLSPIIDLGNAELPVLAYQHAGNYFGNIQEEIFVLVRTADGGEYSEWIEMPIGKYPTNWTFVKDTISLEDFMGSKIQIAFRYKSTATKAGTWEVKEISVFDAENPTVEPEDPTSLYSEACTSTENTLTVNNIDVEESIYVWSFNATYGAKASAYVSKTNHAAKSRLETPVIAIPAEGPTRLTFNQCVSSHFGNVEEEATLWIKVVNATSGAPSLKDETWEQIRITYPEVAEGKSYSEFEKQVVDLTPYAGQNIVIGFLYTSTTAAAGTWEIKDIAVKHDGIATDIEKIETENAGNAVVFDLQGRRVANPTKGIYIVNGKKVLIK